jgi:DNA-binding transcriptional LysR family regulator
MQSWDLIRAFLALHRAGTFEGAGQLLGVDHSTLRRRIQTLEQDVGATLFSRLDGRYAVMPAMRPLLETAMQMEASSRLFCEAARETDVGTVRVTMMDVFASWLAPELAQFRKLYPDIQLDIDTEHRFIDLEQEMVDVAVRLARPIRGNARMRKLAEIGYGVYAAPAYLAGRDPALPDAPHDLMTLSVHFMHRNHDFLVGETAWMLRHLPPGRVVCGVDSYLALRRYCEEGMGLTLLPEILGDESDRLVRLLHGPIATCDLWLVVHADSASTSRVRLFTDFVHQTFRKRLGRGATGPADTPQRDLREKYPIERS